MSDNTYNGWTNWETWVVNLWIINEESSYWALCELADRHKGKIPMKRAVEFVQSLYGSMFTRFPEKDLDPKKINWKELRDNFNSYYEG